MLGILDRSCFSGYVIDEEVCVDRDECAFADACSDTAVCQNTDGSFVCNCATGYSGGNDVRGRVSNSFLELFKIDTLFYEGTGTSLYRTIYISSSPPQDSANKIIQLIQKRAH